MVYIEKVSNIKPLLTLTLLFSLFITFISPESVSATEVTKYDEDVTAYTASPDSVTASGKTVEVGYVAVHPQNPGDWDNPVLPFGATIQLLYEPINHHYYGELWTFKVQDTGQLYYEDGLSDYWIDVYYGPESWTEYARLNVGQTTRTYKAYW